jgi:tetratricopeptide (TPR) repeat protein
MHFLRAQDWHHAVQYLRHAADNAMRRSAYQEAVAYLEQALDALRHLPDSRSTHEQAVDIRFELRNALVPLAVLDRAFHYIKEAEAVATTLQDPRRLGRASSYLTHLFWMTGKPDPAIAAGQRALALASSVDDFALQIDIHHFLGLAYCTRGDYQQTITYLEKNVTVLEGGLQREHFGLSGIPSVNSRAYLLWGLAERGAFAEGSRRAAEALQIAEATNHLYSLTIACFGVGFLSLRQGDLSQAIPVLERGLELCQSSGLLIRFPSLAATLGYAYALEGRVTAGLPLLQQAVEKAAATGRIDNQPLWMTWLSEACGLAGHLDEARHLAERALELSRSQQEWGHQAYALWLHGEIAVRHQHDSPGAESSYRQSLMLAQERGMRPLVSHCYRGLGALYLLTGQREQACQALSTAVDMYRAMDMTFWLPQTEEALTQAEKLY